jgi:hypothetical protein
MVYSASCGSKIRVVVIAGLPALEGAAFDEKNLLVLGHTIIIVL